MTDLPSDRRPFPPEDRDFTKRFTVSEVWERLVELGGGKLCECCHVDAGWLVPSDDDQYAQVIFGVSGNIATGVPFYIAVCRNCTNTRFYPAPLLMRPAEGMTDG